MSSSRRFSRNPPVRQTLAVPAEVRVWQEDQNPLSVVAGFLRDRKTGRATVGIEETARFFAFDGLACAAGGEAGVRQPGVVRGCRMRKSAAEIALMQLATQVTLAAYRWTYDGSSAA